jgi:hypothetical protein
MEDALDGLYDMVILYVFTSDAIPVHLLTPEAMEMSLRKLAAGGLLVVHISNRYLALEPGLGNPSGEDPGWTPLERDNAPGRMLSNMRGQAGGL